VSAAPDPYTRCPDCKFIGLPGSMDYTLTGPPPDGDIDWARPVHVSCMTCHARYDITAADVLQADATMVCKRCAASVTYPCGAARVQCTGCGLFLVGPDLDQAQRAELDITERLAGLRCAKPTSRAGGAQEERSGNERMGGDLPGRPPGLVSADRNG